MGSTVEMVYFFLFLSLKIYLHEFENANHKIWTNILVRSATGWGLWDLASSRPNVPKAPSENLKITYTYDGWKEQSHAV